MSGSEKLKFIELFAGCGGMSLGLEAAHFELFFANELSPMAGETFAFNILNENLEQKKKLEEGSKIVLWLKSKYAKNDLIERLRENPEEAKLGLYSDLLKKTDLEKKLLIGDVNELIAFLKKNKNQVTKIVKKDIDLLSGGPPCQGFSLAGKRIKDDYKNSLPLSFAVLTDILKPKVVLLENVKGITSPFKGLDKQRYYAWLEVSKAFALRDYIPVCFMLNSKYFGIPQNRPRFILIAYRKDIFKKIIKVYPKNEVLEPSIQFYEKIQENKNTINSISIKDFKYFDIENESDRLLFNGELLPKITNTSSNFISANLAIGDIRRTDIEYKIPTNSSSYANKLINIFPIPENKSPITLKNHEIRNHSYEVKSRFRFYQVINEFQNGLKKAASDLITQKKIENEKLQELLKELSNYHLYFKNSHKGEIYKKPQSTKEIQELVKSISTKKHSQRALKEFEPAPAQLTIPDDLCHYHMANLRTLTVREMARFQSFPDWFEFRSKVTTGGKMRKFEVPQYTQVGNAVPPILAKVIGETIRSILLKIQ